MTQSKYHPDTTLPERQRMAEEFQHESVPPNNVLELGMHESLIGLIMDGSIAYLGKGMLQLTLSGRLHGNPPTTARH